MDIAALQAYFWDEADKPQKLGTIDCVKFVTGAVYAGWGRDYRDILQYDDRRSAVRRLRALGGLYGACVHAMGNPYPIEDLHTGDVIWFAKPASIGLLMSKYVAVKAPYTIHRYAIDTNMMGWRT